MIEFHKCFASGTRVTMVFAEVQDDKVSGNLHVQRRIIIEAMLPVYFKTQPTHIELNGLLIIENPEYGNNAMVVFHIFQL